MTNLLHTEPVFSCKPILCCKFFIKNFQWIWKIFILFLAACLIQLTFLQNQKTWLCPFLNFTLSDINQDLLKIENATKHA